MQDGLFFGAQLDGEIAIQSPVVEKVLLDGVPL